MRQHNQLGRSGIVYLARHADTSVPVRSLRRSVADRERPLIIVASGPLVVRSSAERGNQLMDAADDLFGVRERCLSRLLSHPVPELRCMVR
jgi:hypothetical protein